jgi:ABC-type Zn uptake system ZnuABC Zn-binding protein ZnuA
MKKLFLLLAVAGLFAFAACNPKPASTEATATDTTKVVKSDTVKQDTAKVAPVDTVVKKK